MKDPLLGLLLAGRLVSQPTGWTQAYLSKVIERANRRIATLGDRVDDLPSGRKAPDIDQVAIGSGRRFALSILFLDICDFSSWPSSNHKEQVEVLKAMNVFMAEMMNISRDFGGTFEKNTGDGLMAYFGTDTANENDTVRAAVDAAVVMHYVNDKLISPWLVKTGFRAVRFRIGIDFGPVTIGRVGVPGGLNSFVAIGSTANIACKIMRLIPHGGVCIGNEVYKRLPKNWYRWCQAMPEPTGFVYVFGERPYPAWQLNYRPSRPVK